jgi:hypothetical protein
MGDVVRFRRDPSSRKRVNGEDLPDYAFDESRVELRLPTLFPWQDRAERLLARPDVRFLVAVLGRRAGKTTFASDVIGTNGLDVEGTYLWGAPTYDLGEIGHARFKRTFASVIASKHDSTPPDATLVNGSEVLWRSFDREGGAIGRGYRLVVIDEAARVRDRIVEEEILPSVSDTGGKIVAITTPRGRRNWVFDWYQRAKAREPLYAAIRGPSTENPSANIRAFVEVARANMPRDLYEQEIEARFLDDAAAVFRNLGAAFSSTLAGPVPGRRYVLGIDLGKHEDYTVVAPLDVESGDFGPFDRFYRIDWPLQIARIETAVRRWNGAEVWIDATGVGDPIFDTLREKGLLVHPYRFTNESKRALVLSYAKAIESEEVRLPREDEVARAEHEVFGYEISTASRRYTYSAPSGAHDDTVLAAALAQWGRSHTPYAGLLAVARRETARRKAEADRAREAKR